MLRIAVRTLAIAFVAALLVWPLDWAIWRIRVAAGGGMGSVAVRQITVASLKGNKDDYYVGGITEVECSRSLFPEDGAGACWWLARHKELVQQY